MTRALRLALIAARHRSAGLTPPSYVNSQMWTQDIGGASTQPNSRTFAATGNKLLLLAGSEWISTVGTPSFGGNAMTLVQNQVQGNQRALIWHLDNPPGGPQSLTFSGFVGAANWAFHPILLDISGAAAGAPAGSNGGGAASQDSPMSFASTANASAPLFAAVFTQNGNQTMAATGAGNTQRQAGGTVRCSAVVMTRTASGTFSATTSATDDAAWAGVEIEGV